MLPVLRACHAVGTQPKQEAGPGSLDGVPLFSQYFGNAFLLVGAMQRKIQVLGLTLAKHGHSYKFLSSDSVKPFNRYDITSFLKALTYLKVKSLKKQMEDFPDGPEVRNHLPTEETWVRSLV